MEKVFSDFVLNKRVEKEIIEQYKGDLPQAIIDIWKNYGFGSFLEII